MPSSQWPVPIKVLVALLTPYSDLELTKLYHPDTLTAQEMPEEVAYARFRAVTAAYHSIQRRVPLIESNKDSLLDSEADEIRKRLATWGAMGPRLSPFEKARRERALNAEKNAGKWWKTDMTLYYMLGGAVRSALSVI